MTKPCPPQPDPRPLETPSLRLEVQEFGGGVRNRWGQIHGKRIPSSLKEELREGKHPGRMANVVGEG